ncbi:MAG: hypothetical protein PHU93_00295 [Candidatus Gracilibacteria bacterium]|nr:hypothetical protein [Candidatus Gracilibacteria bacterium]
MDPYPKWVRQNIEKYIRRLKFEAEELYTKFPNIGIYRDEDTMYLKGPVITMSGNQYILQIVYPDTYPFTKPECYVKDRDVIDFCSKSENSGHNYHNYGSSSGGLRLCVMDQNDRVNKGWTPNQTGITILEYSIMWLHAYEFKRVRGYWPLPE